jgi:hypothetical protein
MRVLTIQKDPDPEGWCYGIEGELAMPGFVFRSRLSRMPHHPYGRGVQVAFYGCHGGGSGHDCRRCD